MCGGQFISIVSRNRYINKQSVFWRRRSRVEFGLVLAIKNCEYFSPSVLACGMGSRSYSSNEMVSQHMVWLRDKKIVLFFFATPSYLGSNLNLKGGIFCINKSF